jgi:hypothetical protein
VKVNKFLEEVKNTCINEGNVRPRIQGPPFTERIDHDCQKESRPKAPLPSDKNSSGENQHPAAFPVVGIGASAWGLEALEQLFKAMPGNIGMAFVVIQHLSPTHKSIMGSLLAKHTSLAMVEIEDGLTVEPDHVYLAPPGRNVALINRTFQLLEPVETRGIGVTSFFRDTEPSKMLQKVLPELLRNRAPIGPFGSGWPDAPPEKSLFPGHPPAGGHGKVTESF